MPSDSLKKRLAALNRGRLPSHIESPAPPAQPTESGPRPSPRAVKLEDVATGQVVENDAGQFLRWRRSLPELLNQDDVSTPYREALDDAGAMAPPDSLRPDMARMLESTRRDLLFMDLETTGLGGSPLFLIGLMFGHEGALVIDQLIARDYSEERAALRTFHETAERFGVLVSFNGKSFDWPQIVDRSYATGIPFRPWQGAHVDLLHEARSRWKGKFVNCKLQTLETYICRRRRVGDIPGDQIPQAYHDFVRTGNAWQMKSILHHNALDLVTMAQLLTSMLRGDRV